ncbi:MAG: glycine--tRNA ligase subunit beta [Coriobacteriales bacterium]|nr:glycine--tRNA ligase subunit beta [Coriobacteriales bacterium]
MSRLFILEVGTEELPAVALMAATKQMAALATKALDDARIGHGVIKSISTPRRMTLLIEDLADESAALYTRAKGPAVDIAFDKDGNPTKAALGFARGKGIEVRSLQRGTEGGREYVYAIVQERSKPTMSLLPGIMSKLIGDISWPRSQRWGSGRATFARPVRWLLCLWGSKVVPVSFAGLEAGNTTRGHRLLANREFVIEDASQYFDVLAAAWVIPDGDDRAARIRRQIRDFEQSTGLLCSTPQKTFDEVVNLVEYPTVMLAKFDEDFLEVPSEIITDAMLSHQRYFPLYSADGKLSNSFLLVSNGPRSRAATIIDGNERVVRARLYDAKFFYREDCKRPLESYVDDLEQVVFQEKLGSMAAKTDRIQKLAALLGVDCDCSDADLDDAIRAARLCKADLVTNAVVEFTSQQGVMGGYYAKNSGETDGVALAIKEHYNPRFAGDALPSTFPGKMVALCDKLDTICGIFAIGQGPTGSSDPFALRRSAIGIINILLGGLDVSLGRAIEYAVDAYKDVVDFDRDAVIATVRDFFATRMAVICKDKGFSQGVIGAVQAADVIEPAELVARCAALSHAREMKPELFADLATAYTRAANLTDKSLGTQVDPALMSAGDVQLMDAVYACEDAVEDALASHDFAAAIEALAGLRQPIDSFFTDVLIMDKDMAVRENRLRLLNRFVAIFGNVADIGKLDA